MNIDNLFVHFFVTRQRSEPKKTCLGALPLSTPKISRATQKATAFCQITRGCDKAKTLNCLVGKRRGKSGNCRRDVTLISMPTAPSSGTATAKLCRLPHPTPQYRHTVLPVNGWLTNLHLPQPRTAGRQQRGYVQVTSWQQQVCCSRFA